MIDVMSRPSTRATTEEEKMIAIMGPMYKIKKEKEARALLKAAQLEKKEAELKYSSA
jgi:uncharacterized tellurite resistance protein B-like protein